MLWAFSHVGISAAPSNQMAESRQIAGAKLPRHHRPVRFHQSGTVDSTETVNLSSAGAVDVDSGATSLDSL